MNTQDEQAYLDRIAELEKELKRTHHKIKKDTYGLHWLYVPEAFEDDVENKLPILKEVTDKAILNDDGKPTHILIEGDNYHALTCLNYTHKGKIDVIILSAFQM
jgi:adenine-specific DNA-methyltransferase